MAKTLKSRALLHGLSIIACLGLLAISGCPGSAGVVNWPAERLDGNPSTQPVAVDVADMDGDGLKDVISLWRGSGAGTGTGTVAIHFQDAAGGWTNTITPMNARYTNANGLDVADMNGDGRSDVLIAAHDRITCLLSPAEPRIGANWTSFDIAASMATDYKAWFDVAAVQIDGANGPDVVATLNDVGRLVWFAAPADPNSGVGWTIRSIDSTTRKKADSLLLDDLNGDGRVDVICSATGDTAGTIRWYEQPADPTITPWPNHVMTSFSGATRMALGDLDGDGRIDLVAASPQAGRVAWFPHPARVTDVWNGWVLADYTRIDTDKREPFDVAIVDMDADGRLDVVVAATAPASLFWYSPQADNRLNWIEHRIAAIADLEYGLFAAEDTDGDGLPEVIVPVDHTSDDTLDRIDRFVNPTATTGG